MKQYSENTRVKIPAILHLCRLGYTYLSLAKVKWDKSTNIFTDIFRESLMRLNPGLSEHGAKIAYDELVVTLGFNDLGKCFYEMITGTLPVKYIDFDHFENNSFHVVTELPCENENESFRPDITLLINGMPLAFVEVKKPNNHEGILAERDRIDRRFANRKFRPFINISQILVFTNNMEYDEESLIPIQGSFYATTSYEKAKFNCFREEQDYADFQLADEDPSIENMILKDTNNVILKSSSQEFLTNKNPLSPANRILTSLFSKQRLRDLLLYGIAYVKDDRGGQKHIMRYPQFFATKAIENALEKGIKKGIIWHTQGSGKTALAYYNVRYLTEYYTCHHRIVPKFYFIVDRLDLLIQATQEFENRGLRVIQVQSKEDFRASIKQQRAISNDKGQSEITVVNIQKFSEESRVITSRNYDLHIQRIYFMDEVHRSYNPKGSFLANLLNSDKEAVFIGLTGTPLIGNGYKSRDIFGGYIHKYYYNSSIADGYTLKLIREEIETRYKIQLQDTMKAIQVLQQDIDRKQIYAHRRFAGPMLDYIMYDFQQSRISFNDDSIGAMVVCDSSEQARMMYSLFQEKYAVQGQPEINPVEELGLVALPQRPLASKTEGYTAALILHDEGTKEERKAKTNDFKKGYTDLLFVYNMLLTGFDAPRLKKLYLGRVIREHNLLQTLTRVNRPYGNFKYGYVVDFADISREFDKTNKAYFEELQNELGDELEHYSNLFKSTEEIEQEIEAIKENLFRFDTQNAEIFSQQINEISDRQEVLKIKKSLQNARELYNLIRMLGYYDLLEKLDFQKLGELLKETSRHLELLNLKKALENQIDTTNLLNVALEEVIFLFRKIRESELILADQLRTVLKRTREAMASNFDKEDPEFINLYEALRKIFDNHHLNEVTQEEIQQNITQLNRIYDEIKALNRRNQMLRAKYENDAKYARIHKRLKEKECKFQKETEINSILCELKEKADNFVLDNKNVLVNDIYFTQEIARMIIPSFKNHKINLDATAAKNICRYIATEYLNEYRGYYAC